MSRDQHLCSQTYIPFPTKGLPVNRITRTLLGFGIALATVPGCGFSDDLSGPQSSSPQLAADSSDDARWRTDRDEERALAAQQDFFERASERDGDERIDLTKSGISTSDACEGQPGGFDYCAPGCPCAAGHGDCDSDADCASGLVCMRDTGAIFGYNPEVDVCMSECSPDAAGTGDFCSPECPCEPGGADCDDDADCAGDGVCAKNVGAEYGYEPDDDVCVAACDPILNGDWDFCSPDCPCEDGQGDCDSDADCAPGHSCVQNIGADYGYDESMDVCVVPRDSFAGRVIDKRGQALAEVAVSINGVAVQTDIDGRFTIAPPQADRYIINAEKFSYRPHSMIHRGAALDSLVITLERAQMIALDPDQAIDASDDKGTRITLTTTPEEALVDENGDPPREPVVLQVSTFDVVNEGMVGDMSAVDIDGEPVVLQSIGAFSADFVGLSGKEYQLAHKQTAQISVELDEDIDFDDGPIALWYYDEEQGLWIEEGQGVVIDGVAYGEVTHFSSWNFDIKFTNPGCLVLNVDAGGFGVEVLARIETKPEEEGVLPQGRVDLLENGENLLFNLTANTPINIFVPPDSETPLAGDFVSGPELDGVGQPTADQCPTADLNLADLKAEIRGTVALEGRTDHSEVRVELRPPPSPDGDPVVKTNRDGSYVFSNVDPNRYEIFINHPSYLAAHLAGDEVIDAQSGTVAHAPCMQLSGGDIRGTDHAIDGVDEDAFLEALIDPDAEPLADINGDTKIDGLDEAILDGNRGKVGPTNRAESQCSAGGAVAIHSGGVHTCAVMNDGRVICWGDSASGQLGYSNTDAIGDNETLISLNDEQVSANGASQLVTGGFHSCILVNNGDDPSQVHCWGRNSAGQLGYSRTDNIGDDEAAASVAPVDIGFASDDEPAQLAAGLFHTCALSRNGEVRCWGDNGSGQLGYSHSDDIGDDETPAEHGLSVDLGGPARHIAAGAFHTCAIMEDEEAVKCWGRNSDGQLGYGDTEDVGDDEHPSDRGNIALLDTDESVVALAAGYNHTCAHVRDSGGTDRVRCWGRGDRGQLGRGDTDTIGDDNVDDLQVNIAIGSPGDSPAVKQIVAGRQFTCALLVETVGSGSENKVQCWGRASEGQLGHGDVDGTGDIGDDETPQSEFVDLGEGVIATQLTAGLFHACARLQTSAVKCWGRGNLGQLGYGNTNSLGDNESVAEFGNVPFLD
ncbi:MAG: hypothetical protein Tsb0020_12630 [Haliangiales bacterium]